MSEEEVSMWCHIEHFNKFHRLGNFQKRTGAPGFATISSTALGDVRENHPESLLVDIFFNACKKQFKCSCKYD